MAKLRPPSSRASTMKLRMPSAIAVLFASLTAQAPPTYYNSINTTSAATLRQTLHTRIHDHTRKIGRAHV